MSGISVRRVVILGCGFAGIVAAAALQGHCDEVVLLEQDFVSPEPRPRRGVPQSEQLHNLLGRAQLDVERLLPGFVAALRAAGCGEARVADQTHVFENGNSSPLRDLGLSIFCVWRPLLDNVVLKLVLARGGVKIRTGVRAIGLRATSAGEVSGAILRLENGSVESIDAEIVVDATGAGSRATRWLASIGQPTPVVEKECHGQWYVTCLCKRPAVWIGDPSFWLTFASPPHTRSGLVSPATAAHWYVSMSGRSGDMPPRTFAAMQEFSKTLEDSSITALLEGAVASDKPHLFRRTISIWRRYELLPAPLLGFLPIGDAIGVLNPLMGQGISVAAWQASGLLDLVNDRGSERSVESLAKLTKSYLQHAGSACGSAWNLESAVNQALRRGDEGLLRRSSMLSKLIAEDPEVHRLYVRVWHLLEPAEKLADIFEKVTREEDGGERLALGPLI